MGRSDLTLLQIAVSIPGNVSGMDPASAFHGVFTCVALFSVRSAIQQTFFGSFKLKARSRVFTIDHSLLTVHDCRLATPGSMIAPK
jgi:hypothetical protein